MLHFLAQVRWPARSQFAIVLGLAVLYLCIYCTHLCYSVSAKPDTLSEAVSFAILFQSTFSLLTIGVIWACCSLLAGGHFHAPSHYSRHMPLPCTYLWGGCQLAVISVHAVRQFPVTSGMLDGLVDSNHLVLIHCTSDCNVVGCPPSEVIMALPLGLVCQHLTKKQLILLARTYFISLSQDRCVHVLQAILSSHWCNKRCSVDRWLLHHKIDSSVDRFRPSAYVGLPSMFILLLPLKRPHFLQHGLMSSKNPC